MNNPTVTLDYSDSDGRQVIAELRTLQQQESRRLVGSPDRPLPGFPVLPEETPTVYQNYRVYYRTPWGLARTASLRYYKYPTLSRLSPLEILEPEEESRPYPEIQIPELGTALVDPITGLVRVYVGEATTSEAIDALSRDEPVWTGMITIPEEWRGATVLHAVRTALARAGIPLWATTLLLPRRESPWDGGRDVGYVSNDEARVALVGFALDHETREVIYLHMVGHKTALRSIWGSLNTVHARTVTVGTPTRYHYAGSSHNYTTYTDVVDTAGRTGLIRMLIVDKRAYEAEVVDKAYLVLPQGIAGERLERAFASRLTAVLPVPVAPAWGRTLRQAGDERGLVTPCLCGGDVGAAYVLTADETWLELLHEQLVAGELTVN